MTLMYGTVFPAPDIGKRCAAIMREVRDAGFEVGIHTWDHVLWQDSVATADAQWTREQMQKSCDRFEEIFGTRATVHGAAGWQMNRHSYRLTQQLGFDYCSDTRGNAPFIPIVNAEIVACPQLPTTLPTLDELIGVNGLTKESVAAHLLALTAAPPPTGHVYTLHAELEGQKLMPVFEQLLQGWQAAGYQLVSLKDYFENLDVKMLPRHCVNTGSLEGRSGTLAVQGQEFLAGSAV